MTILTVVFALAFSLAAFCRGTGLGAVLHRVLVERPAEHIGRGPIAATAQLVGLLILAGFAIVAPELLTFAVTIDFALFAEVAALLFVARAGGWARTARLLVSRRPRLAALRLFRPLGRSRQRQPKPRRQRAAPKNPEPWPWAFA